MTSTQVACGALLLFVFALVWSMVRENNKRKKKFLEKIKKSWGAVPTREYSWDELEQISAYHKAQPKNSFVIDEITWNDLDMDRIFMLMNQTVSSAGIFRREIKGAGTAVLFFKKRRKDKNSLSADSYNAS